MEHLFSFSFLLLSRPPPSTTFLFHPATIATTITRRNPRLKFPFFTKCLIIHFLLCSQPFKCSRNHQKPNLTPPADVKFFQESISWLFSNLLGLSVGVRYGCGSIGQILYDLNLRFGNMDPCADMDAAIRLKIEL